MLAPLVIENFEIKSHQSPDEVRTPSKTRVEIVRMEALTVGRFRFEPGWRWSECIKPVVKTESCQLSHAGYAVSGRLAIRMNDGTQKTIGPGQSFTVPPGHDAWVEGNEPFVAVEIMSAEKYARP